MLGRLGHQPVRVDHEFVRDPGIEMTVALGCSVEADHLDVDDLADREPTPQNCLHQLPVVLQHRGLPSVQTMGLCPAEAETKAQHPALCRLLLSAHDRLGELVAEVLGVPEVDCAIDCVGFEAKGQGSDGHVIEAPAVVLNGLMEITRPAGSIGIPGLYVTDDPGAKEKAAQQGMLSLRFGLGWAKSHSLHTGQTPVLKYNRQLMQAILWGRLPIGKIVNVNVISLDRAPEGYRNFDAGVPNKFVIDPHGLVPKAA